MTNSVNFLCQVHVKQESRISIGYAPWGPNIYFDGKYYPGRIVEASKVIPPGGQGELVIGVIIPNLDVKLFKVGKTFLLKDGPTRDIAEALIVKAIGVTQSHG